MCAEQFCAWFLRKDFNWLHVVIVHFCLATRLPSRTLYETADCQVLLGLQGLVFSFYEVLSENDLNTKI